MNDNIYCNSNNILYYFDHPFIYILPISIIDIQNMDSEFNF